MLNKKGASTADWISYIFLIVTSTIILSFALFFVAPLIGDRAKISVTESVADFNENIFLFNYLRYPVGDKTMADLVIEAHNGNNYDLLKTETVNFFNELYSKETRICCKRIIEDWHAKKEGFPDMFYAFWKEKGECEFEVTQPEFCLQWRVYVNDKRAINHVRISNPKEKTILETYIPNYYNLEPIKFAFVFY